ncbi:hypothetical protein [Brachyspira pulli]|uniref:hypothetical protein n=1 Tax=Brachyspira pulli TaxID=310721 RepID=UPI0030064D11
MKKCLFILSFMLFVMFSEKECKGPDGDSKPTPFRKENAIVEYKVLNNAENILYSVILFSSITIPSLYFINKKFNK